MPNAKQVYPSGTVVDLGIVSGRRTVQVTLPQGATGATGATGSTGAQGTPGTAYLFSHYVDANNVTTGETDLYSDTLAAGQLAANGDRVRVTCAGVYAGSATATSRIRLYFGGTAIFDSAALAVVSASVWEVRALVVRVSSTVVRYSVVLLSPALTTMDYQSVGELTGLTLSNTQVVKITGQSSGTGAGSDKITAKLGIIE